MSGVSMKSGLEDRNNLRPYPRSLTLIEGVSMKSGLEDRNNEAAPQDPMKYLGESQ